MVRRDSAFLPPLVFVIVWLEDKNEISENTECFKYSEYIFNMTDIIKDLFLELDSNDRYSY